MKKEFAMCEAPYFWVFQEYTILSPSTLSPKANNGSVHRIHGQVGGQHAERRR